MPANYQKPKYRTNVEKNQERVHVVKDQRGNVIGKIVTTTPKAKVKAREEFGNDVKKVEVEDGED